MKIAFVGKGGSGKTTLTASFSKLLESEHIPHIVFDADINMHMAELLGFDPLPQRKHLSHPETAESIREYLRGTNPLIGSTAHFKKTTPPGRGSHLIDFNNETCLDPYILKRGSTGLAVVGSYDEDEIGASCYHNNLAILENILSHTDGGTVVCDMVAGTDAFANTLHVQFDMIVIVVEPTRRSLEVFDQYYALAEEAGITDMLFVVGNKTGSEQDRAFIRERIPSRKLLGFFDASEYLAQHDRTGGEIEISRIEPANRACLEDILSRGRSRQTDPRLRLSRLHALHERYVAQASVRDRFGDLTGQIDTSFSYRQEKT